MENIGLIYQVQNQELRNSPLFGVRAMGLGGHNSPRFVSRPRGMGTLLFLQLHQEGYINGEKTGQNACVIWPPSSSHHYGNNRREWSNSWIHFTGDEALSLAQRYNMPLGRPFYLSRPGLFDKYISLILEECRSRVLPDRSILKTLYTLFLTELKRDLNEELPHGRIPGEILKAKDMADTAYHRKLTLSDFSRECHLSANYLTGQFKKHFGRSLIDYLIEVRITHAKELLSNVNLPVDRVAETCGYDDTAYFSKLFKKQTGHSPTGYRRKINSKEPL